MNYTENYHLPQWVKEDRIMMDDFNDAMARLENGLTTNKEAGDFLQKKIRGRFGRLAYNHYCVVQDMDPFPCQSGVFHQNFVKDQTGLTGTLDWKGARFAGRGSDPLTAAVMGQCYQEISKLQIVKGNLAASTPLIASFRTPASGYASRLYMGGTFNVPNESEMNYRLRFSVINLDTGAVEHSEVHTLKSSVGLSGGFAAKVSDGFYFLGNTDYHLKLEALDAVWDMTGTITPDHASVISNTGVVTAQRTIHEPEFNTGGFAVLRGRAGGAGGTLRFVWDGEERAPAHTRRVKLRDGTVFQEYIYIREDQIPEDTTISLRFECAENGNFLLRDWGVVLL